MVSLTILQERVRIILVQDSHFRTTKRATEFKRKPCFVILHNQKASICMRYKNLRNFGTGTASTNRRLKTDESGYIRDC